MANSSSGWLFKAAESNGDTFVDALADDALFVHNGGPLGRFLFGSAQQSAAPSLLVDGSGIRAPNIVCDSNASVSGTLSAFPVVNVGSAIVDLRADLGALAENVLTGVAIGESNVSPSKLSSTLPVSIGGTGRHILPTGLLVFGSGIAPLGTSSNLSWNALAATLSAANASVAGNLEVGSRSSVERSLDDLDASVASLQGDLIKIAYSDLIDKPEFVNYFTFSNIGPFMFPPETTNLDVVVRNSLTPSINRAYNIGQRELRYRYVYSDYVSCSNICFFDGASAVKNFTGSYNELSDKPVLSADNSVLERHIADGAVSPKKIRGPVPVSSGGTGITGAPSGSLLFSVAGAEALSFSESIKFDHSTSNLSVKNAYCDGRVHAGTEIVVGRQGSRRFRIAVGGPGNNDLIVSSIDPDGTEAPYVNLGDVAALLASVNVVPPVIQ